MNSLKYVHMNRSQPQPIPKRRPGNGPLATLSPRVQEAGTSASSPAEKYRTMAQASASAPLLLPDQPIAKRGASILPQNRFERNKLDLSAEYANDEVLWNAGLDEMDRMRPVETQFIEDLSRTIISRNDSPDIGFNVSVNPYRGCEHGCIYCYARPTHEYLGYSLGLDFETKILFKPRAAEMLRAELSKTKWMPKPIALSGVTDPYQPVERRLRITRACLEVLAEFRQPVTIVTKNALVTRDLDLLKELAMHQAVRVHLSIPTLDAELRRVMEPRTSPPVARLAAVRRLADAGIPVGVLMAPVIPGLTEYQIMDIAKAAAEAGASSLGVTLLRLPYQMKELFLDWVDRHYPEHRAKIEGRIREIRGGQLNQSQFGERFSGTGPWAEQIQQLAEAARKRFGLEGDRVAPLSARNFGPPQIRHDDPNDDGEQLEFGF